MGLYAITEETESIIYNGSNHDEVHKRFRKWESEWGFNTNLFTYHHNSYEETMKGNVKADLIIKNGGGTVPFGRRISFIKLSDGKIVINIKTLKNEKFGMQ